jgi:uncharacterized protein
MSMAAYLLNSRAAKAEVFAPAADRLISGDPRGETRNAYESSDNCKFFGEWSADKGAWRVSYSEWEYCHIIKGSIRLTHDDGNVIEANAGDDIVIEPGFEGVWENLTPVRKLYVIILEADDGGGAA